MLRYFKNIFELYAGSLYGKHIKHQELSKLNI